MKRRPSLSELRIRGLVVMAEAIAPKAAKRVPRLFGLPPEEREAVRSAMRYVADLATWDKEKKERKR